VVAPQQVEKGLEFTSRNARKNVRQQKKKVVTSRSPEGGPFVLKKKVEPQSENKTKPSASAWGGVSSLTK